jgi:hypothetical protein
MRALLAALAITCVTGPASAEVVDRGANGFTLKAVVDVPGSPQQAYRTLVNLGLWWDGAHTYTGDARKMSIDARPGGCWCEALPDGGGVEHGRVVNAAPGSLLRLNAALGPLQEMGVSGSLTFQIVAKGDRSVVTMTYAVGGYTPGGFEQLAPLVDSVMTQQVDRLKQYLEKTGR